MNVDKEKFLEKSLNEYIPPPRKIKDSQGHEIELREYREQDFNALYEMYIDFDPAKRAQGIPPISGERIKEWLDNITQGVNLVALNDSGIVGHAILMPDKDEVYELAIFVHQDYQGRRIGTELIKSLLAHAKQKGITYIWLTVERWNEPAQNLYRRVGFESIGSMDFEMEMGLKIARD